MDAIISIGAIIGMLLVGGTLLGQLDRARFSFGWLAVAGGLVLLNDLLLTNAYGLIPNLLPGAEWNWQGKTLALLATLAVASHPRFGWRRAGITWVQAPGSLRSCAPVALAYVLFFVAIGLAFPTEAASAETIAFQLTMPSLEEEPFYRGIVLLALYEAFAGRHRALGVDWSWGALLSCLLFGLAHAFSYADGQFALDPIYLALTAVPSLLAVWLRLRSGSLLLPVVLHSVGNAVPLLI